MTGSLCSHTAALGAFAFCLYALGSMLAFLRDEMHLSYTMISLHSSLWAAGSVVVGIAYKPLVERLGRRRVLWGSAAAMAGGTLLFIVGHRVGVTLLAAGVLGTAGTLIQTEATVIVSDHHGRLRDRALVEANIGASAAAIVAPAILGSLHRTPLGWRPGMLLPLAALAALWLAFRRDVLPDPPSTAAGNRHSARLPLGYWRVAAVVALVVGIEFCIVFYGALLLRAEQHLSSADAATAMSVFFLGMLAGRILGSRMTQRPGRTRYLLLGSLATTMTGFAVFWLTDHPLASVAGLLATGVGVAALYPLSIARLVARVPRQSDQAIARVQILVGAAVITGPLGLGALADHVGVFRAFTVEPALIILALLLVAGVPTKRCARRSAASVG